jgi:hypothetical protein
MSGSQTLRSALSSLVSDGDTASSGPVLTALDPTVIGQALYHFASAAPVAVVARLGGLIDELNPLGHASGPSELFSPDSITHHLNAYDAISQDDLDEDGRDDGDLDDGDDSAVSAGDDGGVHRVGPAQPDGGRQHPTDSDSDDDSVDDDPSDETGVDDDVAVSVYDSVYETEGELEDVGNRALDHAAHTTDHRWDAKQGEIDVDDQATDGWSDDADDGAPQPALISSWDAESGPDDDDPFDDPGPDFDDLNDV